MIFMFLTQRSVYSLCDIEFENRCQLESHGYLLLPSVRMSRSLFALPIDFEVMSAPMKKQTALAAIIGFGWLCGMGCDDEESRRLTDGGSDASGAFTPDAAASATDAPSVSQLDPAPAASTPGFFTVAGSPTSNISVFERNLGNVTKETFSGTVSGAVGDGVFYIVKTANVDGTVAAGMSALSGPIPTDANGAFNFTAPLFCGTQLVKCVWSNAAGRSVLVTRVITTGCIEPDIRVTISWDAKGRDWELHLIKPGGKINDNATDCTWTSCVGTRPDWGVKGDVSDDPSKDVDDKGDFGPESIFLSKPEAGIYTVMVEHWGAGAPSAGQAIINIKGQVTVVPLMNFITEHVRTIATIDWPAQTVNVMNTDFDCSATWSSGCKAAIP